ncbi:hypothetical protein AB0912_15765 [Streptomyces sp. NPDC007084]|uniref:hypothetical protein n=1 Tax=Streptomyces sp. NPDC007084 TaxID=3154313 RepID=UPI0034560404
MASDPHDLGHLAYTVYSDAVGHKDVRGGPLPAWHHLSETIQTAWGAAAHAVQLRVTGSGEA